MFNAFERTIAFRYLRARKGERFVSVIAIFSLVGIALGVATLIIVMSVMNGFRAELLGRILGLNGHLGIYAAEGPFQDYDAVANRIRGIPGIVAATPIVEGQVLVTSEAGGAAGGLARGITPEDLRAKRIIADGIRLGSLADFHGEDAIVIGTRLASRLRVTVGDTISLVSPQGRTTVFGTVPRAGLSAADTKALSQRTLTNLYNARPAWLALAHTELDAAVAAAYGWADYTPQMGDDDILARLLALNLERAGAVP